MRFVVDDVGEMITHTMPLAIMMQPREDVDASVLRVPGELQDLILNYMDKSTLSMCTLISRSHPWSLLAREHLFRAVAVAVESTMEETSVRAISSFLRFLELQSSKVVLGYIKVLKVGSSDQFIWRRVLHTHDLSLVIAKLPALEDIHLSGLQLNVASGDVTWPPQRRLKTLHLHLISFALLDAQASGDGIPKCSFGELLNVFSEMQALQFRNVWFTVLHSGGLAVLKCGREYLLASSRRVRGNLCIRRVVSSDTGRSHGTESRALEFLYGSQAFCSLRSLDVHVAETIEPVNQVLAQAGPHLQDIRLVHAVCHDPPGTKVSTPFISIIRKY